MRKKEEGLARAEREREREKGRGFAPQAVCRGDMAVEATNEEGGYAAIYSLRLCASARVPFSS